MTKSRKKKPVRRKTISADNLMARNTEAAIKPDRRTLLRRREQDKSGNILRIAEGLIYGARNKVYRHPTENFNNIAAFWNVYFAAIKVRPDVAAGMEMSCFQINNIDVSYMNILQKIARGATNQEHEDTVIDIAGYAGCIERITKNK